jgi:subtilase family serine protease
MFSTKTGPSESKPILAVILAGLLIVGLAPSTASTPDSLVYQPALASHPLRALDPGNGIGPDQLRAIYGIDRIDADGLGVTVAVVVAYHSPNIERELATYSAAYGLPACTKANGCLKVVYADGRKPRSSIGDWDVEAAMDVEIVHTIAPAAHITLVEAADNAAGLDRAVAKAVALKPQVITMSWGGPEDASVRRLDALFARRDIAYFAGSGDEGRGVNWPAVATNVVAVGGTIANHDASVEARTETAWSGSGGGVSKYIKRPAWQQGRGPARRSVPDVSAISWTRIAIYSQGQWQGGGGTSAASPIWAAIAALAVQLKGGRLVDLPRMLESLPTSSFFDITSGSNGSCGNPCRASTGYDLVTGRGSPNAQRIIQGLAVYPQVPADLDSPIVSIAGIEEGDWIDPSAGSVNVTVTAQDASGVSGGTFELVDAAGQILWSTDLFAGCGPNCEAAVSVPLADMAPGYFTLRARAVDSAHNSGWATVALAM